MRLFAIDFWMNPELPTPKDLGFFFPAEFFKHEATWLTWPHKEESWPGKIQTIYSPYAQFVKHITEGEKVNININDGQMEAFAKSILMEHGADLNKIQFHTNPSNDAWCRDHGPAFLINPDSKNQKKVIVDWNYNAWGNKYPPFDLDDVIPTRIGKELNLKVFHPGIIMEGGSVEFNGKGTIITSKSCLLNKNRNPELSQSEIEWYLCNYYGADQILWVEDGIIGDDTDGHIDDTVRFVNEDTILAVIEENKADENYLPLQKNLHLLSKMRLNSGKQLNIIELPMPEPVEWEDQRLPASYANFYIANAAVVVPVFGCTNDDKALQIIQSCFPDRKTIGINSRDLIWGLGSFHCLSQQEPEV